MNFAESSRSPLPVFFSLVLLHCGPTETGTGVGGSMSVAGQSGAPAQGGVPGQQGGTAGTATSGGASAGGRTGSGGTISGGSGGGNGGTAMSSGGAPSSGGKAAGGGTSGGTSSLGGGAGTAGATGGTPATGGSTGTGGAFQCPSGITGKPTLSGATASRVTSVPPLDDFNMQNKAFGIVEGAVWTQSGLYVSELSSQSYSALSTNEQDRSKDKNVNQARILRVTEDGNAAIVVADSGSNGLALDANGNLIAAVHKDGSIVRFSMPGFLPTTLATGYMGVRFNSPNDLVVRKDGTIYFTDPVWQAPDTRPQAQQRVYRLSPAGEVSVVQGGLDAPNGIALSPAEDVLYVAATAGRRYQVAADGTTDAGQDFSPLNGGDGLAIDCAGNIYVAKNNGIEVYDKDGVAITPSISTMALFQQATNVAFGGADRKTLYITGLGQPQNGGAPDRNKGLAKVNLTIPGKPY